MNRIILLFRTAAERRRSFGVFRASSAGWLCVEPGYTATCQNTEIRFLVETEQYSVQGLDASAIVECPGFFRPTAEYLARVRKPIDT